MASDKLMNHTQGETIITKLTAIADSLDDLAAVTPAKLGMGIATCDTPASTAAKTAALANFALVEGAPVSVQFTYANTATNATLNINNTGAKPIIYKDAAIGNDVISAGDTCTFIYTTNTYKITNIDTLTGPGSGTVRQVGAENGLITDQTDNADIQTTGNIGLNLKSNTAFSTEVGAHNTSTDNMYPVALDSEGHPVAAVPTMSASGSGHKGGLVPDPGNTAGTKKYLAEDGSWKAPDSAFESTPTDNTIPSSKLVKDSLDAKVAGPVSSTQNNIATYSDASGKTVKDSGVHVVDYATGADTSKDDEVPTSKAVNKMITDKGYVVGPSSVTGDTIALFDSTTGKLIKSSSKTFDSSAISNDANKVPTSKLVYEGLGGKVPTTRTINDKELSSNVTLSGDDLKLTNYSKTTSKDSLAATDKVNQAFDKLENRIVANQSNILYGLNTGVKNKLPCKISNNNQSNDTGLKCNYNEDGTYTVKGTKSTSDSYLDIENIYADKLNGDHVAYISVTGTGTCQIAAYGWNGTGYTLMLSTSTSQGFNIGNYAHVLFRIRFMDSVGTSYNATVKAMVCTMEAWNQSHDWQPPALPNQDLTYLEAQDRASLAEVVDSGSKNLLNCDKATIAVGAYPDKLSFTRNGNEITVTSTGTPATTGITISDISNIVPIGVPFIISGCPTGGGDDTYRIDYFLNGQYAADQTPDTGNGSAPIVITNATGFYIRIRIAAGAVITNKVFKLMVCTKAAFGVSPKFVAYRGTFGNKAVGTVDMNSLTVEGNYYVSNATKATHHAPKDGYFFVDVYTTENGEKWQKAYRINEPQYIYQRQMTSNTWGTWYIFTGTAVS